VIELHIKKFGVPETDGMAVINGDVEPCPAIMAKGIGGVSHSQYWLVIDGIDSATQLGDQSTPKRSEP
jgi:hypothetical protein